MIAFQRGLRHPYVLSTLEGIARGILWVYSDKRRTIAFNIAMFLVDVVFVQAHRVSAGGGPACTTGAPGLIDTTAANIQSLAATWPSTILGGVTPLYWAILGLAICFALVFEMPGTNGNPGAVFTVLAKFLFLPVFLSGLFFSAPTLGPALVNGFISTGASADTAAGVTAPFTSLSTIEPGHVFKQFDCLVDSVDGTLYQPGMVFDLLSQPVTVIKTAIQTAGAELTIHGSGLLAMVELFGFQVEATFVLGIGIILMVGLASQVLMGFPMRYLGALIGLGIKGAGLALLIGVMLSEAASFQTQLNNVVGSGSMLGSSALDTIALTLLALAISAWFVPNILATLGGAPGVSFGTFIAAALTLSQVLQTLRGAVPKPPPSSPNPNTPTAPTSPPPILLTP